MIVIFWCCVPFQGMDLDECAKLVLERSHTAKQVETASSLQSEIVEWIGRVDPVTGACDRSGAVGVIEDLVNKMQPRESDLPIEYYIDRNAGKGGRGTAVWCHVTVTLNDGRKMATAMTTQQVIYGHNTTTYHWRGLLPLWRGTTKEHNVTITKWALLSRHQGVCRTMWTCGESSCVAEFSKALQKIRIASRRGSPVVCENDLAKLITKYNYNTPSDNKSRKRHADSKNASAKRPKTESDVCPLALRTYRDALREVRRQEKYLHGAGDDFIEQLARAAVDQNGIEQVRAQLAKARAHRADPDRETGGTDWLLFRTAHLQAVTSRRHRRLVEVLEAPNFSALQSVVEVGEWGAFHGVDLQRALLEDEMRTTSIKKTWDRLMPLVNGPDDPIVVWTNGKPEVNKKSPGYEMLVKEFGPAVRKLVIEKRKELERHNPSGMYPVAYLRKPETVTSLAPSDVLALIASVVDRDRDRVVS
jgi:hypothetical protein